MGDKLPPGSGQLVRRPDQQATSGPAIPVSAGSNTGVFRGYLVVISAGRPGSGIFVYSPTPGPGNLIGSWTAAAGVDAYGNAYPAGLSVDEAYITAVQLIAQAATLNPGPLLLYGSSRQTQQVLLTGSGNWTAPASTAGVPLFTECWGAGEAGAIGQSDAGGTGGTGGEYAAEPSLAVTPAGSYAYAQGTGGGNSTFAGDSVTVIAHGGTDGGTGSSNSIHFNGGAGGAGAPSYGGGGGGSSAGTGSAGNAGQHSSFIAGGAGGAAPSGGGAGGQGGNSGNDDAVAGSAPGGGGGGGGAGTEPGKAGGAGQIRLTWTPAGGTTVLDYSLSSYAGTDSATGDTFPAGMFLFGKYWLAPSGDTTGVTDWTNITAAVAAYPDVELLPGLFTISQTLNLKIIGLRFWGNQYKQTRITLATGISQNQPIMEVAGEGQDIGWLRLGYAAQQVSANTLATVFVMGDDTVGNCFMSRFHDMIWFQGAYGSTINPDLTASAGFFSCQFDNIRTSGWSISAHFWDSAAGTGASNCTGSVFNNFYNENEPTAGTQQTGSAPAIDIRNFDEIVFNQLNVEHCTINSTDWFNFQKVGNVVINSLHCERLTLAGSSGNAGMFAVGDGTNLEIQGMSVYYATINGTVWNPVARFFGAGSNVTIRGYNEGSTNAFGGASSLVHQWAAFSGADCVFNVTDVDFGYLISQLATGLPASGCYCYVQFPGPGGGAWTAMGAPVSGWTVGGVAQYRTMPNGTTRVQITDLQPPGTPPTDATTIFVAANGLTAGFAPAVADRRICYASSAIGTETPALEFETDGSVKVYGVGGTTISRMDLTCDISTI